MRSGTSALRCHLDIESYSEVNLSDAGVYRYAEHESTELLVAVYRFGDGVPHVWIPRRDVPAVVFTDLAKRHPTARIFVTEQCPYDLDLHIRKGREVAAHNAQFERVVLNGVAGQRVGFPRLSINQMVCTAAKAVTWGLPRKLGDCAKALGSHAKDETGRAIMLKLCRPRSGANKRWTLDENVEDYVHLFAYCVDDVLAECGVDAALQDLTPTELEDWRLDQRMNDRGVGCDLEAVDNVQALILEYKELLAAECIRVTGAKPTQRELVVTWVRKNGYPQITDMQADTVAKACVDPACPESVANILRIYSTYGMKAVAKYTAIDDAVCRDSRIHGMFMYYGAGTGRWSSMIVQLQNLFRPKIKDPENAIEAFKKRSLQLIRDMYPDVDPMKVFASCVRGTLIPADGADLIVLDYAGIESRYIAWMYDELWKLDAFRRCDADPNEPDNYKLAYANGFGIDPRAVTKWQRQIGKVMELALAYEGGVGAFVTMAPVYGVDLTELADLAYDALPEWALESAAWMWEKIEKPRGRPSGLSERVYLTIDGIKQVWRRSHPAIKQGWKDTLDAGKLAVKNPGRVFQIPNGKLKFCHRGDWLRMRLPSGRMLNYYKPELSDRRPQEVIDEEAAEREALQRAGHMVKIDRDPLKNMTLTYMGVDSRTRQWKREHTYGGKAAENGTQAGSNCLLRSGMRRLDRHGYPIVLTVHDEAGMEVDEGFGSKEEAAELMCTLDPCHAGLPVRAEGYRAKRYRKE